MKFKYISLIVLSFCALFTAACGGGGGGGGTAQPTLVTVKIRTTGTLPAGTTIGGVSATVSAAPSTGLTIADADVNTSEAGAGSVLSSNTTSVSAVVIAVSKVTNVPNETGMQIGEFVTLQYHVAAGTFPVAGNFSVALNGAVKDTNDPVQDISGIDVAIQSVTIQ